jgi:hypothetical protein
VLKLRQIGLLLILILLSLPSWATFTFIGFNGNSACGNASTTCDVTVTVTADNVLILAITEDSATGGTAITGVTGGCAVSWQLCPSCYSQDTNSRAADIAYCLSSAAGTSTVTVTRAQVGSVGWVAVVQKFSHTGTVSFDTSGNRQQTTATTSHAGVTLTPTGANDLIVQVMRVGSGAINSITSPYTIATSVNQGGFAYSVNTVDGAAPTWTSGSSVRSALSAIAIKESTAVKTSSSSQVY